LVLTFSLRLCLAFVNWRALSIHMMNLLTWFGPWQPTRVLMSCVLVCMALAVSASVRAQEIEQYLHTAEKISLTLSQALESAWQRSLEASESRSRLAIVQADQAVNQSWLAASPAFRMGQRDGQTGTPSGSRETELGLSLPLWWPGLRAAGGQVTQYQLGLSIAKEQAERLRLAGRLREAIGALNLAEVELNQVQRQVKDLGQLTQDVEKRVRAGDLSPSDALAARSELLGAQARAVEARQALAFQQSQWHLLTGVPSLKLQTRPAPTLAQLPDTHPELVLANAAVDMGQRRAYLARLKRSDLPELSVGMRQEQPGQGAGLQSSVVVALRVPVGGQVYQQPSIASALGELDISQTQAVRTRQRLTAEVTLAQSQLSLSHAQLQTERERAQLLSERARLIDKSFRAGESALPDMLRALTAAASAESAFARQQINHQIAIARIEQALGLLP
jgi:outer membrane protein TolC